MRAQIVLKCHRKIRNNLYIVIYTVTGTVEAGLRVIFILHHNPLKQA